MSKEKREKSPSPLVKEEKRKVPQPPCQRRKEKSPPAPLSKKKREKSPFDKGDLGGYLNSTIPNNPLPGCGI